jgi:hypothetical protein
MRPATYRKHIVGRIIFPGGVMGIIRGKIRHGDGGRGLAALGLGPQVIQVGDPLYRKCWCCDKLYSIETGEEVELRAVPLMEFLKERGCQHKKKEVV